MLRRIPEPGSIQRPFHVDAVGIRRRQHDLGVGHVHPTGVVVDRTGALIANTFAGAVGRSLGDLAALASRERLDVQKVVCHRA